MQRRSKRKKAAVEDEVGGVDNAMVSEWVLERYVEKRAWYQGIAEKKTEKPTKE